MFEYGDSRTEHTIEPDPATIIIGTGEYIEARYLPILPHSTLTARAIRTGLRAMPAHIAGSIPGLCTDCATSARKAV